MSRMVTLELPDEVLSEAHTEAVRSQQTLEEILVRWIRHGQQHRPVESMSDTEVLLLCELTMPEAEQAELSEFLEKKRDGELLGEQHTRLEELLQKYRQGTLRKAQAWHTAVARGLKPRLS